MSTFDYVRMQRQTMERQLKEERNDQEYIRMDAAGIEVMGVQIRRDRNGGTVLLNGFEENGREVVIVMPEGHFSCRLSRAKKTKDWREIGFRIQEQDKTRRIGFPMP